MSGFPTSIELVDHALLIATLPSLTSPHFLAEPIATSTRHTKSSLTIVLFSRTLSSSHEKYDGEEPEKMFDVVQRLLTFCYVHAVRVAVEMDKVLMDINVVLRGFDDDLENDPALTMDDPQLVYRISGDSIANPLPASFASLRTHYITPSTSTYHHTPTPSTAHTPDPLHPSNKEAQPLNPFPLPPTQLHAHYQPHPPPPQSSSETQTQSSETQSINNPSDTPSDTPSETQTQTQGQSETSTRANHSYPVVALGGTFDYLHPGHKILLSMGALLASKQLIIGITSSSLLFSKAHSTLIQPYATRDKNVKRFLKMFKPRLDVRCVEIDDPYGPTKDEADIQALVVSRETRAGGEAVNKVRKENGLGELAMFLIDVISPSEMNIQGEGSLKEKKLSSSFIRQWIANR